MRKLVYHVATTLDNFIAHEDGTTEGFLQNGEHIPDYLDQLKNYDTVVMGKATYEYGYAFGMNPGDAPYPHMRHYIFSKSLHLPEPLNPMIEIVRDEAGQFIEKLKQENGTDIYLCGGTQFASYLFQKRLIDKIVVKLNPVIFGKGMPMLDTSPEVSRLHLDTAKVYESGVVLLTYSVLH